MNLEREREGTQNCRNVELSNSRTVEQSNCRVLLEYVSNANNLLVVMS